MFIQASAEFAQHYSKGTRIQPGLGTRTILEVYALIKNEVFEKRYQVCISFEINHGLGQ